MPVKIFIGNLSSDTTSDDLRPLFEGYGHVTECDVLRNFGFVHMQNEDDADKAINELSGTPIKGQRINVEKSTGEGRGGGCGGGGGKMRGGPRGCPHYGGRGGFGGRGGGSRGGGRGGGSSYGRDYDPYPPPRGRPYDRDPYDFYDRGYDRPPPMMPPPYEERRPYDIEVRLPPRDPYDRYPPPRYPPPRPADSYDMPPTDYYRYRACDGYDDPVSLPRTETEKEMEKEEPSPGAPSINEDDSSQQVITIKSDSEDEHHDPLHVPEFPRHPPSKKRPNAGPEKKRKKKTKKQQRRLFLPPHLQ